MNNREVIKSTLEICKSGYYYIDSDHIPLSLTYEEMERAQVYLPEDVKGLIDEISSRATAEDSTVFSVRSMGSLEAADMLRSSYPRDKIAVLNFANGTIPGGSVMVGSRAQEEDMCRKSTLYISLDSENARPYYDYNKQLKTFLASDSIIYSPNVEVFRDNNNDLLKEPYVISVISCAAPVAGAAKVKLSPEEYRELFYRRICGVLSLAAKKECKHLVLGAWGCGTYANDAAVVAELFHRAFNEFRGRLHFENVVFAVQDRSCQQYNYNAFKKVFI